VLKSSIGKYSEPNWSKEIYEIEKVRPSQAMVATNCVLKDMPEKSWVRENLQLILGDEFPEDSAIQTTAVKKAAEAPRRSSRNK
jgi:hypothetical protein